MTDITRAVGRRRDAARLRLLLLAVGIVTGVLTGCSSGPSSQTAEGAAPTSSSGDRTCVSASDGPEVECQLKAGTYRFVISDRSDIHDFHLSGPGLNRVLTAVEFIGTKSFSLTLKKGSYHFQCDPHAALGMKGRLEVESTDE